MMKVFIAFICVIFAFEYIWWLGRGLESNWQLVVCDVGQGDGMFLRKSSLEIVIDAGVGTDMAECLSRELPLFDNTLEVVIATHLDADHIGGMQHILKRYKIDHFYINPIGVKTKTAKNLLEAIVDADIHHSTLVRGDKLTIENASLHVLWPPESYIATSSSKTKEKCDKSINNDKCISSEKIDTNDGSIVFRLEIGDSTALFTGDLGKKQELTLVQDEYVDDLLDVDLLKVGHHGSCGSTTTEFLHDITPKQAIISAGRKNKYGHPCLDTLKRLEEVQAKVWRTDELATLHFEMETDQTGSYWRKQ